MLKRLLLELRYLVLRIGEILTLIWHSGYTNILAVCTLVTALLYSVTGELLGGFLLVVFLAMFLIHAMACLLTMTKMYGWRQEAAALVATGVMLGAMACLLLMVVSLLAQSLSCT